MMCVRSVRVLRLACLAIALLWLGATFAAAQTQTTGAISGTITDPTGAVIPGAGIYATSVTSGIVSTAESQGNGHYLIPQLKPGEYMIVVKRTGFQSVKQGPVEVNVASNTGLNFKLQVGQTSTTVEVTGAAPLLQPENPNISTTLNTTAIANLPNPGNDLTFLAQVAPGATISTTGSFFNATYNGLPGTSANFTIDGASYNDPFLGLNNSGPTNLSLGSNDIQQVNVATNPYSVDEGNAESANINYVSKRGGNNYHGNASWQWNGRTLNAYDTFVKSLPVAVNGPLPPKPFDNVNNYAASVGGPILSKKLFFFVDEEGARVDLPVVDTGVNLPTAGFIAYAAQQIAAGGCETGVTYFTPTAAGTAANPTPIGPPATGNCAVNGTTQPGVSPIDQTGTQGQNGNYLYLPPNPNGAAFQQHELNLYQITNPKLQLSPHKMLGCPLLANGSIDPSYNPLVGAGQSTGDVNLLPDDPGCASSATFSGSNLTWENKLVARTDWDPNPSNQFWFAYNNDRGLQATGLSAVNPIFNQTSFQPSWGTNLDWTHVFNPNFVNDAAFASSWYSAPFAFEDQAAVNQVQPLELRFPGSEFARLGSVSFPQGRNVTILTAFDNANFTHGSHQFIFGTKYMRERLTDYDFLGSMNPEMRLSNLSEFLYGVTPNASLSFPVNPTQPIRLFGLGLYGGDTWQLTHNFTLTYGLRVNANSNPKDPQGVLGNPVDWQLMDHDVNISPAAVSFGSSKLFNSVPFAFWQPRIAFAYQPWQNWLVKGGWGMFETVAPAVTADNMVANPPFDPSFTAGYSPNSPLGNASVCPANATSASGTGICGVELAPNDPNSAVNATRVANGIFQSAFTSKAPSCAVTGAPANCIPVNSIFIQPADGLKEPYADEWSFGIQRQMGRSTALSINYIGNRSFHNPLGFLGTGGVDVNAYQAECAGCFAPYASAVPDPRFSAVTQARFDGYSTYNGLQVGLMQRAFHGFTLNLNYAWAHSLSSNTPYLDGLAAASTYRDQGQPFNVLSATYTYQLPWHTQSHFLGELINGWQVSGATFSKSGDQLFMNGNGSPNNLINGGNASQVNGFYPLAGVGPYSKNKAIAAVGDDAAGGSGYYQWINPYAFASSYDTNTDTCFNPASSAYVPASAANASVCQFPSTYAYHLFGPGFEWTNFFLTKTFQVTEGMQFRIDAQAYNLFNHPNYGDPDTTAVVPGNSSTFVNADAISSMASPSTGLLGNGLGGDNAPRMVAFEGKIIF